MALVKTSGRALMLALIPPAFLQGALLAMAVLGTHDTPNTAWPAPDLVFGIFVARVAIIAGALYLGHQVMRQVGTCSRFAYGLMGLVAGAAAYAANLRYGLDLGTTPPGTLFTAGILPALAGALAGFLYGQFAGIEYAPERVDDSGAVDPHSAFRGRFEGPVRVRTSLGAIGLAAVLPAGLVAILAFVIFQIGLGGGGTPAAFLFAFPAQIFLSALLISVVPSGILMLITHHLARALNLHRGTEYAALGAGTGFLMALMMFPFSPFTALPFLAIPSMIFGALMGALYRRFAGIEPVPLPEPVLVSDVEALVPEDDVTRCGHSIVLDG
jgi:hypothetical protein